MLTIGRQFDYLFTETVLAKEKPPENCCLNLPRYVKRLGTLPDYFAIAFCMVIALIPPFVISQRLSCSHTCYRDGH